MSSSLPVPDTQNILIHLQSTSVYQRKLLPTDKQSYFWCKKIESVPSICANTDTHALTHTHTSKVENHNHYYIYIINLKDFSEEYQIFLHFLCISTVSTVTKSVVLEIQNYSIILMFLILLFHFKPLQQTQLLAATLDYLLQ